MQTRITRATAFPLALTLAFLLTAGAAPAGLCGCGGGEGSSTAVTVERLKSKITADQNTVLLDVRTSEELSGELGKLDGIIHIPLQELESRHGELAGYKDKDIYVVCRSGNRSGKAADMLRSKGYRAINVEGGMRAWRASYGVNNH